jgi:hypothetical protein
VPEASETVWHGRHKTVYRGDQSLRGWWARQPRQPVPEVTRDERIPGGPHRLAWRVERITSIPWLLGPPSPTGRYIEVPGAYDRNGLRRAQHGSPCRSAHGCWCGVYAVRELDALLDQRYVLGLEHALLVPRLGIVAVVEALGVIGATADPTDPRGSFRSERHHLAALVVRAHDAEAPLAILRGRWPHLPLFVVDPAAVDVAEYWAARRVHGST